jgi:serine/threonine protein kinase
MLGKNTVIGKFSIEKPLSINGGTATVYVASITGNPQMKLAMKLALKTTRNVSAEDNLLQKEAELISRPDWRHQGVVRLFPIVDEEYTQKAIELEEEPWYMTMEYLRGYSLEENLKQIRLFPLPWKLELFYQICITVSFLHGKKYAHRDLKPDNIVFREPISSTKHPQPVLIDFALTSNGNDIDVVSNSFTTEYASPERILKSMGRESNYPVEASDIWSLGLIFYEILTGESLLKGTKEQIRSTVIKNQLRPQLPPGSTDNETLGQFIAEMLHPNPDDRLTIDSVIRALEAEFPPPRIITS